MITTYFGYIVLVGFGLFRDFFAKLTGRTRYKADLLANDGAIASGWERFYVRRLFNRIQDCFARPVVGRPSTWIEVAPRRITNTQAMKLEWNQKTTRALNLGSYNYLGFADEDWDSTCGTQVHEGLKQYGVTTTTGPIATNCITKDQELLGQEVASFIGKEDAVIFGTGYGTNAWAISKIVGKGCLILSDSLNHTSIVNGCRTSGAKTVAFKHNDERDLENLIREHGFGTNTPPTKILVIVEGLYSMEGEICNLKEIVRICKKYKCYLYVDEAHSIGALGETGSWNLRIVGGRSFRYRYFDGNFYKVFWRSWRIYCFKQTSMQNDPSVFRRR